MPAPPPADPARRARLGYQPYAYPLYGAVLVFLLWRLPVVGNPASLDGAWQGLLQHDWTNDVRAGVGSVFTYGPAGFLFGSQQLYSSGCVLTRYWVSIAVPVVVALVLMVIASRLPTRAWRLGCLAAMLVLAPFSFSDEFLTATGLALLCLQALGRAGRGGAGAPPIALPTWALLTATCVAYAFAGMAKFTYLVLVTAEILAIALALLLWRRQRAAAALPLLFVAAFAIVWLAIGQSLGDVPAWLHNSSEIAKGYNEVMSMPGESWAIVAAAGVGALDLLLLLALLRPASGTDGGPRLRRWLAADLPRAGCAASLVLALFLTWKAGFVRHDAGHALLFFGFTTLLPFFAIATVGRGAPRRGTGALAAVAAAGALALDIVASFQGGAGWDSVHNNLVHAKSNLTPGRFEHYVDQVLARNAAEAALPHLHALVGEAPIDIMGHQQGLMFAAGFTVRHRPVFQSYSAYTPHLQEINAAFFRGAEAPRFVLARVQAEGGHLPLAEDSGAWRVLLDDYYPAAVERGVLLLERRAAAAAAPTARRRVVERDVAFGEWVELPDDQGDWHELGIDAGFSLLGRAIGLLHRPGWLLLDLRTDRETTWRISPLLVRSSFLLDPLILDDHQLLASWLGRPDPGLRVRAVRVRPAPGKEHHYRDGFRIRLDAHAPPAPDAANAEHARALLDSLQYPGFAFYPFKAEPPSNCSPKGSGDDFDDAVFAHTPCELFFSWPGGHHVLAAGFSLPEASYTNANECDGVAFHVEVGEPRKSAFEQLLQPRQVPADRGWHELRVDLDLPAGTVVVLRTDPGPLGDYRWDWAQWRRVRLDAP